MAVLEVTDGWYAVRAVCDKALTGLTRSGRILPGIKIRVCGAELVSPSGPAEPLHQGPGTFLRLRMNNTHKVHSGTKLGRQPHSSSFLPLSSIHTTGGTVPLTMVTVLRKYPTMVWARLPSGIDVYRTLKGHAAVQRQLEGALANAEVEAGHEVQEAEVARCRRWLSHGKPGGMTHSDRLYANAVIAQASASDGSGSGSDYCSTLNPSDRLSLERRMAQRNGELQEDRREALKRKTAALPALPEKESEVVTLLIGSYTPNNTSSNTTTTTASNKHQVAVLSILGGSGGDHSSGCFSIKEGEVYAVSGLEAQVPEQEWGQEGVTLGLKTMRGSMWKKVGGGVYEGSVPRRNLVDLSQLSALAMLQGTGGSTTIPAGHALPLITTCFDYIGFVVKAGGVHGITGGEFNQWIFLADPTVQPPSPAAGHGAPAAKVSAVEKEQKVEDEGHNKEPQQVLVTVDDGKAAGEGMQVEAEAKEPADQKPDPPTQPQQQQQQHTPWLLAICLTGTAEAIDWIDPITDQGSILGFKDLKLRGTDTRVKLWQADGRRRTTITRYNPSINTLAHTNNNNTTSTSGIENPSILGNGGGGQKVKGTFHSSNPNPKTLDRSIYREGDGGRVNEVVEAVAVWAVKNPEMVNSLRERIEGVMRG